MNERELAERFAALAVDTRLRLLELLRRKRLDCGDPATCDLSERCCSVGELARALGVSPSTVSHHLGELRRCGLVRTARRGRHVYCWPDGAAMRRLAAWLADRAAGAAPGAADGEREAALRGSRP